MAAKAGRHLFPPALRRVLRPFRQYPLAWRLRAVHWLRRHGVPWRLSRNADVFDRYKRVRARMCAEDLSALRVPEEPGLISIVLPIYNGEDYLREAVDSVLGQTWPKFELIAVDDGSTDETAGILAEYARRDRRIRVIAQTNQKLPQALNTGFQAARGEFLTWISADNRFKPGFLTRMAGCLHRHPEWDMVYADEDIIDSSGRPFRARDWYPLYHRPLGSHHVHFPADVSELNTGGENYVGAAFLYRARTAFLIGGYDPERFGLEDYDYWMRVNELLTLRHADFNEPVYEYRLHSRSLTSRSEELGIEPSRAELLVLDDCRRDFCLARLIWRIDAEQGGNGLCRRLAAELRASVISSGTSSPSVRVHITAHAAGHRLPAVSSPVAFNVWVAVTDEPLPEAVPDGWALCAAWSASSQPQRISGGYRGWLVTDSPAALHAAIDIRARSHLITAMEKGRLSSSAAGLKTDSAKSASADDRTSLSRWRIPHVLVD